MYSIAPDIIIYKLLNLSVFLLLAAAGSAIILSKHQQFSTIFFHIICVLASFCSGAASVIHLISWNANDVTVPYQATVPFLSVSMTFDALSAFFVLLLSVLTLCVSVYSIGYLSHYHGKRNVGLFQVLYAIFILSMIFVFTADHAIFFFMAWEIMAVVSYFLVVFESEQEENRRAGLRYIIMTHIGTAFITIAFMMMYQYTNSFSLSVSSEAIPAQAKNIMFLFFLIGFGTKAGVIPFHIWLPYAHPAAPGNISALMSGIMIKTAIYGILRFVLVYLGIGPGWWGTVILIIGMVSAVMGVLYAFIEQNIKKMLAYSSIENMGIIFIGLGISFIAFSRGAVPVGALALTAALLHTMNHTLFKGSLFLGVGSLHFATHTKNLEEMGGLIRVMPLTAVLFLGSSLSIAAIVPFNGFIGEWLTYQSLFASISPGNAGLNIALILAVAALALAGALAAACFIKLFGIAFLGLPRSSHASHAKEVPLIMNIGTGILVFLCLAGGLYPLGFLQLMDKAVFQIAGCSMLNQLQGQFILMNYPLEIAKTGTILTPQMIFVLLAILILLTLIVLRLVGGKYHVKKYGTWDCGFIALNERMQYSGTAFSKPIKIVFKIFFKSSRDLKVIGDSPYHPGSMEYTMTTESVFEKYVYVPFLVWTTNWSKRLKFMIQTGSVHTYLLYIFIAVLVLMFYNRIA